MRIIHAIALPALFTAIAASSGCKPNQIKAESIATPNDRLAAILNIKSWDVSLPENFGDHTKVTLEYYNAEGAPTASHFASIGCGKYQKLSVDFHSLDNGKMTLQALGSKQFMEEDAEFTKMKSQWSSPTPIIGTNEIILYRKAYYRPEGKTDKLAGIMIIRICPYESDKSTDLVKKAIQTIEWTPSVRL